MSTNVLPPELERRISELEKPENLGEGFTSTDWVWLIALGIVGPVLLLMWGWS